MRYEDRKSLLQGLFGHTEQSYSEYSKKNSIVFSESLLTSCQLRFKQPSVQILCVVNVFHACHGYDLLG